PKLPSGSGTVVGPFLWDGHLVKSGALPLAPFGQQAWIQFEFPQPQTIRAVTLVMAGPKTPFADTTGTVPPGPDLQASDDGQTFRNIVTLPGDGAAENTVSFPEVTARFFRASFTTLPPAKNPFGDLDLSVFGAVNLPARPT